MDATTLSLPLFTALSCVGAIATLVIWIYSTFERKEDAKDRHDILQEKVVAQENLLREVSQNVSFIRGKLEH